VRLVEPPEHQVRSRTVHRMSRMLFDRCRDHLQNFFKRMNHVTETSRKKALMGIFS